MGENLPGPRDPTYWMLIRDSAVFQFKLVVDGFRDVLLLPASFVAALLSLTTGKGGQPGPQFYRLLGAGKRSERWIDLFAAYRNAPSAAREQDEPGDASIDDIVHRVEAFVVDEYKRGGVTAQAKARIDKALGALLRRSKGDHPPE